MREPRQFRDSVVPAQETPDTSTPETPTSTNPLTKDEAKSDPEFDALVDVELEKRRLILGVHDLPLVGSRWIAHSIGPISVRICRSLPMKYEWPRFGYSLLEIISSIKPIPLLSVGKDMRLWFGIIITSIYQVPSVPRLYVVPAQSKGFKLRSVSWFK